MSVRVYLDTSPVIYFVEEVPALATIVDARLAAAGVVPIASSLTRMECRVKPIREGDAGLLQDYDDFFSEIVQERVSLTDEILERATLIRAHHAFKTPDAIHLAAAATSSCDVFLTNDRQLAVFPDVAVEIVEP